MAKKDSVPVPDDPQWYKDAIIYEVHVRAFCDADGDGVGDFQGLTEKLDYLQDLGVTAIWILPFYPSPLKDDGYDIADYTAVNPTYGTLRDFNTFLREAHKRGLRVITELVLNHSSDQHPWFQRARRAKPGSRLRDYYVWSDTPEKYKEARVIFKDFEASNWTWDSKAGAYYWHRFYSHQPDLNFDNAEVRRTLLRILDFWLSRGVDGLRLDAIPYLYEREGTNCENVSETHGFLRDLRKHVDRNYGDRMLLAEANQWPEDAIAYFGEGDECHMAFHFPVMPRLFMAIRMENRFPIIDILQQTPTIPENCQWAIFLRNHDELTLEMVTDEERDYMYRMFAHDSKMRINLGIRRRLAPLLGNDRKRIELMNSLLFSLPGTPVLYYGDEIGMGDNFYLGDRNGVRTPMQWSADRNAGFSRALPHQLYLPIIIDPEYHYEAINVETQQQNPHSLLWWMKRLIGLRRRFQAFSRGEIEFLQPENYKVLVFTRTFEDEKILVVANLSRFAQAVELELEEYKGLVPVELFGGTRFPPIGDLPYFLTLGAHSFYWFSLESQPGEEIVREKHPDERRLLTVSRSWTEALRGRGRSALENLLPEYLSARRWFGGKARRIRGVEILDTVPVSTVGEAAKTFITVLEVEYAEGEPESYVLPLTYATGKTAVHVKRTAPEAVVARLQVKGEPEVGILYDALHDPKLAASLLEAVGKRRRSKGIRGEIQSWPTAAYRTLRREAKKDLEPHVMRGEQSNTSIVYGEQFVFKLFRRLGEGQNPDLEVGRFLTEKTRFEHIARVAGALEYRRPKQDALTLGILQAYVPNQGDAWNYTLDSLGRFFDRVKTWRPDGDADEMPLPADSLEEAAREEVPKEAHEFLGTYEESAALLGRRTGELHLALASETEDPAFAPEPFSALYQRSLYQSMRNAARKTFQLMRGRRASLPEELEDRARKIADREEDVLKRFRAVVDRKLSPTRLRVHGDYHLGQVLFTGKDFVIIDFEGEPARSLTERRLKRSPLVDVAGMLRSFHYAAYAGLRSGLESGLVPRDQETRFEAWADFWYQWVSAVFLRGYLDAAGDAAFLPPDPEDRDLLLEAFLLEKAVYELGYELNNRPEWVRIPLQAVSRLLRIRI